MQVRDTTTAGDLLCKSTAEQLDLASLVVCVTTHNFDFRSCTVAYPAKKIGAPDTGSICLASFTVASLVKNNLTTVYRLKEGWLRREGGGAGAGERNSRF